MTSLPCKTNFLLQKRYGQDAINVGDEGGFAPNIQDNKEGLELLKTAIAKAGYTGKEWMSLLLSSMITRIGHDLNFKEEKNDGSEKISGGSLKNVYKSFITEYPIVYIEDPFDQDDWEIGEKVQIVEDGLLVTNPR